MIKRKNKSKILAAVLSACMTLMCMPITALAATSANLPVCTYDAASGDYQAAGTTTSFSVAEDVTLISTDDPATGLPATRFLIDEANPMDDPTSLGLDTSNGYTKLVCYSVVVKAEDGGAAYDGNLTATVVVPVPTGMDPAIAKLVADNGSGAFDYSNPASYDASAKSITVNKTLTVSTGDAYEEFFVEYKAAPTPPPASTPTITEGNNTEWVKGSEDGLVIRSDAPFAEFVSVTVDGNELDPENYEKREGSTIITLKSSYLATLSSGEHTISINSVGGSATATITIAETPRTSGVPKTFDYGNAVLLIIVLLMSSTVGIVLISKKKEM